jgi:hypothetical protein
VAEARKEEDSSQSETHEVDVLAFLLEAQIKYGGRVDFTIPRRGIQGRKPLKVRKGGFLHIRELLDNAVTYGTAPPGSPLAWCRVSLDADILTIEVTNESPPINLAPLKKKLLAAVRESRVAEENDGSLWVCNSETEVAARIRDGLARRVVDPENIERLVEKRPGELMFVGRLSGHESEERPGGIGLHLARKMARAGGGDLTFSCSACETGLLMKFTLTLPMFEES